MKKPLADRLLGEALDTHPQAQESGKVFVLMLASNGKYVSRGAAPTEQLERATTYTDLHGAITGARISQKDPSVGNILICPLMLKVQVPVQLVTAHTRR